MEVLKLYNLIKQKFKDASINESDLKALFSFYLGNDFIVSNLLLNKITQKQILRIANLRIKTKEPIYSLIGFAPFYGRFFKTHKQVLKPRLDTEILLNEALKLANKNSTILDLCAGSGILGITLNLETNANVTCADISQHSINLIKQNKKLLNANVNIVKSDMFKNIKNKFDIIVSNPPYIKTSDIDCLDVEVKKFDPHLALDGGSDGLDFYRTIKNNFEKFLNPNGTLILEIGFNQLNDVTQIFKNYSTKAIKDFNNLDRVVIIKLKG